MLMAASVKASGYGYNDQSESIARYGPTREYGGYQHDRVWGHGHYEPGDIERFDGHHAEIYGADDLAWGPNGFANAHAHNDATHNWDDQGDAYVCHACGGHGCTLCGGYGHEHKGRMFGYHGHNLKMGFGVGHTHAYLGKKPRSSYNRYKHGVGGRYTQRWTNGYGGRYGLGHGERYGLAHRWSQYNGYGHGNPSSKGSVLGYGLGANAAIPQLYDTPNTDGHQPVLKEEVYDDYYEPEYGYEDDYHYEDDYGYEPEYGYEDDYGYDDYEEPYPRGAAFGRKADKKKDSYYKPKAKDFYIDFARGFGKKPGKELHNGRSTAFKMEFGHGSGNHSPFHGEVYRHDAGLYNYVFRPKKQSRYHTTPGYSNNQHF